jgi:hypothetical protein
LHNNIENNFQAYHIIAQQQPALVMRSISMTIAVRGEVLSKHIGNIASHFIPPVSSPSGPSCLHLSHGNHYIPQFQLCPGTA